MATKKDKSTSMDQFVYNKIKEAIIKRNIRPHSQLVETTIAEKLGVSRTPVRAAIRRLEFEGYAEISPMRGAFVIKPSIEEISEIFEVRCQLEGYSAFLAAAKMHKEDCVELDKLIELESKTFEHKNFEAYSNINNQIHLYIAKKSGNKVLYNYIYDLLDKTNIYLVLFDPFYQIEINPSVEEHRTILKYLCEKNQLKASDTMRTHLIATLNGLNLIELQSEDDNQLFL